MGIQSLDLVGIHEKLAVLRAVIEGMHVRPSSTYPINKEIQEEELLNI